MRLDKKKRKVSSKRTIDTMVPLDREGPFYIETVR